MMSLSKNPASSMLPSHEFQYIRNSTVSLASKSGLPFLGSAWIAGLSGGGETLLLTAGHLFDLWKIQCGEEKTITFEKDISIVYKPGSKGLPAAEASLSDLIFFPLAPSLDLLVLKSKDRALRRFCEEEQLFRKKYFEERTGIFYGRDVTRATLFVQSGYGRQKDVPGGLVYPLGVRIAAAYFEGEENEFSPGQVVRGDLVNGKYENVILLEADETSSSLEGDSGGPVFLWDTEDAKLFPVGVTLGVNYSRSHASPPRPIWNSAVTCLDSRVLNYFL